MLENIISNIGRVAASTVFILGLNYSLAGFIETPCYAKEKNQKIVQTVEKKAADPVKKEKETAKQKATPKVKKDESANESRVTMIIPKDRYSLEGRYARTYRWVDKIRATEEKYGLEEGIIFGVIMHESGGDPISLNEDDDGGAGLCMFMPGTAKELGLKTAGTSNATGKHVKHGKKLEKLVKDNNGELGKLSALDDRFNPNLCIDAMGRYLSTLKKRYGTTNKALAYYNAGYIGVQTGNQTYINKVRPCQEYYFRRTSDGLESQFVYVGKNKKGKDVFRYVPKKTDSSEKISEQFNTLDEKSGNKYSEIETENVVDKKGKPVTEVRSGAPIYVVAKMSEKEPSSQKETLTATSSCDGAYSFSF